MSLRHTSAFLFILLYLKLRPDDFPYLAPQKHFPCFKKISIHCSLVKYSISFIVLPGKQKEKTDVVKVKESNIATLFIHADNSITLDGKPIVINHIMHAIEDRIYSNPKLVVLLKVHPEADYGMMVSCLDELKLARATKVSLKTSKK